MESPFECRNESWCSVKFGEFLDSRILLVGVSTIFSIENVVFVLISFYLTKIFRCRTFWYNKREVVLFLRLEMMWQETVVACFNILLLHLSERTAEYEKQIPETTVPNFESQTQNL